MVQWTQVLVGKRRPFQEHGFVQGTSKHPSFVHVERDIRLLVHGDNFMVEMPTHEEKRFRKRLVLEI